MASKCTSCNNRDGMGCDRCEVRGMVGAVLACATIAVFAYLLFSYPDPKANRICSDSCTDAGHSEHAIDTQRGCVCSDPYPEVPKPTRVWVKP